MGQTHEKLLCPPDSTYPGTPITSQLPYRKYDHPVYSERKVQCRHNLSHYWEEASRTRCDIQEPCPMKALVGGRPLTTLSRKRVANPPLVLFSTTTADKHKQGQDKRNVFYSVHMPEYKGKSLIHQIAAEFKPHVTVAVL
jgi:hypothetical protein